MKLKYLGTAAAEGWPALFCKCESCERARKFGGKNIRTRSQSIIDNRLLIDFGPDTYLHVLQHHMPLEDIHHVLVTHSHIDHLYLYVCAGRGAKPLRRRPYFFRRFI